MHFQIWLRFSRPHFLIMGIYWYKNGGYVTWHDFCRAIVCINFFVELLWNSQIYSVRMVLGQPHSYYLYFLGLVVCKI